MDNAAIPTEAPRRNDDEGNGDGNGGARVMASFALLGLFFFVGTYFGPVPMVVLFVIALVAVVVYKGRAARASQEGTAAETGRNTAAVRTAALPAPFAFKRDVEAAEGWMECVICLGLVKVGELVRRLPTCRHLFHDGCIDQWLRVHATCPLCRAEVVCTELPV